MTGRLWPLWKGVVKPARQPACRKIGEQHLNLTAVINPSDLTLLPADRRMLEEKRNPSPSPRGLKPGCHRSWPVRPEPLTLGVDALRVDARISGP